jgi:hypothetical protein
MDSEPKDLKKEISRRNPGDAIDTDEFKVYPIVFESTGQLYEMIEKHQRKWKSVSLCRISSHTTSKMHA